MQRAREQQHCYTLQQEARSTDKKEKPQKKNNNVARPNKTKKAGNNPNNGQDNKSSKPPRTGCWICKGSHWLSDCPTASEEEKIKQGKT